jgi:CheY-like chemotaxis protein
MNGDFFFKNVMLIDDSRIDNMINKKVIENEKFAQNVQVFTKAIPALQILKDIDESKQFDHPDFPQVIFLDLVMPEMDGFEFILEFNKLSKELTEKIYIIILSSSQFFKEQQMVPKCASVLKYLVKPLIKSNLAEVRKVLEIGDR